MSEADDERHAEDDEGAPTDPTPTSSPLKPTFGTAVGAVMMGLELALRSEPPAEVMAAEHAPERGQVGWAGTGGDVDDDLVIVVSEPPRRPETPETPGTL
jgi:hypothetical protein